LKKQFIDLASIFGMTAAPEVDRLYDEFAANVTESAVLRSEAAAMHNALRAMVVHPGDRFHPAIRAAAMSWFGTRQTARGDWGPEIPFYQAVAVHALRNKRLLQCPMLQVTGTIDGHSVPTGCC
jgi:Arc/MetJ family transcription regulator